MLWCTQLFTKKFFSILKYLYFFLIFLFKYLYLFGCGVYVILYKTTKPVHQKLKKPLIFFVNTLLFFFITIPWFIYGEFLKPFLFKSTWVRTLWGFLKLDFFLSTMTYFIKSIFVIQKKLYWVLWKYIIDFIFFKILRNKQKIKEFLWKLYVYFIYGTFFYFFIYSNLLVGFHNFFFYKSRDFISLETNSILGCMNILISLLNVNYLLLYIYTIFGSIGFFSIFFCEDFGVLFGCHWMQNFVKFGLFREDASMFEQLMSYFKRSVFNVESIFDLNKPIFFFFGFFFFFNCCF